MDYILPIVVFIVIITFLARVISLENRVRRMEHAIDELRNEAGLPTSKVYTSAPRPVQSNVQTTQPVSIYQHVTHNPPDNELFELELIELINRGDKIEAIKRVREHSNLGLREAKEYVERFSQDMD